MGRYNYYVVFVGRQVGIFTNWDDVKLATEGFPNARFKGYRTLDEAQSAYVLDPLMPARRIEDIATTSNAPSAMPTPFTLPPNEAVNDVHTLHTHMAWSRTFLGFTIGVIRGWLLWTF